MLASACPGWVCYAEKTHGDYVLPHISATKSPQVLPRSCANFTLQTFQRHPCALMSHSRALLLGSLKACRGRALLERLQESAQ